MSTYKKALIKWTVSRAQNTYGYNIVTLTDCDTGKKYRTNGGGYDMTGTVFADWIQDIYQAELMGIAKRAHSNYDPARPTKTKEGPKKSLYGMTAYYNAGKLVRVRLDGACGLDSIIRIAEAIGLETERIYDRSKRNPELSGFFVSPKQK